MAMPERPDYTLNTSGSEPGPLPPHSISNTAATNPIFSLGTGTLTVNTITKAGVTVNQNRIATLRAS